MKKTLNELKKDQKGVICSYTRKDSSKKRLMEMGLVKGTEIQVEKHAPLGDPIEVKVRGYSLTLRKKEAEIVEVDLNDDAIIS